MRLAALVCLAALTAADAPAITPLPPHVSETRLVRKTDRYGHNVLGGNEYEGLQITYFAGGTDFGQVFPVALPRDRVFEDLEARIADMDGDGFAEVVVVESSIAGGAELAIYGTTAPIAVKPYRHLTAGFAKIASTPPIGRRNRWLAPVGIADLNGDGQNDVAYVETPHIGGTLRAWTMHDGALVELASDPGYSNHRIGEDFITGGIRDCGDGPELVLPDFSWSKLLAVRLSGASFVRRTIAEDSRPATVDAALRCEKL